MRNMTNLVPAAARTRQMMRLVWLAAMWCAAIAMAAPVNVLLITLDDMNWDSIGVNGCVVAGVSPHMDRLASQGMRFDRAHVTIAVCQPTRAVWMTGMYPFRNGAEGFEPIREGVVTLPGLLKRAGYQTGVIGKTRHVLPSRPGEWDVRVPREELYGGRGPEQYHGHTRAFLERARGDGRPFFLMVNAHDPHRPFAGSDQGRGAREKGRHPPVTNAYRPEDVPLPGFLPDLPEIRLEMSEYFTSVRRGDRTVGAVLRALDEAGYVESTLVIVMSDHGISVPFAKTNCYYHSTRTPLIVRWPGVVKPGTVDVDHFVSGIDLMPTVLEAVGVRLPAEAEARDGRSFVSLLRGGDEAGRDRLLTTFHKTSGRRSYEMRAWHDKRLIYIFNAWSDGETRFRNESQSGRTMKAMIEAAEHDPDIAARVDLFLYRVPEELYDYQADPDGLHNLVEDAEYRHELARMRGEMLRYLRRIGDPVAPTHEVYLRELSE